MHDLAVKSEVSLSDLTELPYISISRAGPGPSYLQLLQAAGVHPEVPLTSRSRELVQAYVGKGLGYTLVGFPPKQELTIEGEPVVVRPLKEKIGQFRAVIARPSKRRLSTLVDDFLELCRTPG